MKFMSSFQCLMGGNAVQFKDYTQPQPSSLVVVDNKDDKKSSSSSVTKTTKKTKTKTKKKKKDKKVIKVFKPDGEINLYHKSIRVSELMTEEHMVCRSDSFYIGHKIPPLSQNERLQPGHTYFLLPAHFFHSVLSFLTIASFTSSSKQQDDMSVVEANNANMKMKAAFLKKAATSSCSPFDIQKTPSGTLRIRVSEWFISQMMMDQAAAKDANNNGNESLELEGPVADLLCTTPHLHREYKQLVVGSRRIWKPKLEMIKETSPLKGKRKVKMLLSASINRMKKKMKKNKSVADVPEKSSSSSSSSSSTASSKKKKKKKTKKSLKPVVVSLSPSSTSQKSNKFSKTT